MNKTSQNENSQFCSFMVEEDHTDEDEEAVEHESNKKRNIICNITDGSKRDIKFLSKGLIIAMLYVALNLDESDIQLSHLYRFLQEKHLDIWNLSRLVPEDINVKKIPQWTNFLRSKLCTQHQVRALAMSLLRKLDLGTPKVPDLRNIINNFLTELCLPNDIKPFVYSLMHYRKCDFLDIDNRSKKYLMRMPDYEGTVMTYILVAIKMCFGLDSDYEIKLSDEVDRINQENDLSKSYKIGKYSEPSDRLFSFREWCSYLQFRKVILSKHNLRIAEKNCLDVDDYVYLEHMEDRPKNNEELPDKISMEIINRLPLERNLGVIPKDSFIPTLTPLSDYTDIIIDYCQDPEIKLKLAEDYKRYSLKYASENLDLLDSNKENIIEGVSRDKKTESKIILGTIVTKKAQTKMVYVKNCENRNWLKTKPPTIEHVICAEESENVINEESDHGYDSEVTSKEKDLEQSIDKTLTGRSIIEENTLDGESAIGENIQESDSENIVSEKYLENNQIIISNNILRSRNAEGLREKIVYENNCLENELNFEERPSADENLLNVEELVKRNAQRNNNVDEEYRQKKTRIIFRNFFEKLPSNQNFGSCSEDNLSDHSTVEENTKDHKEVEEERSREIISDENNVVDKSMEKELETTVDKNVTDQNFESCTEDNLSDHSTVEENTKDHKKVEEERSREIISDENNVVDKSIEKELDTTVDKNVTDPSLIENNINDAANAKEEQRKEIIVEEDIDKSIFDDCFEDLTFKEECEQNNVDHHESNENDVEDNRSDQIQNNYIPEEDFDRRSDISDIILPVFNPDTFNRDGTIKELILHACKKYKIAIPTEYRTKEPRKRKERILDSSVPTKRTKRAKYEGEASVKQLLSNYYNYMQADFVTRVQQEMSLAVRNSELQNHNSEQNNDPSNLQISVVERNSIHESGLDSPIARSIADSTLEPMNDDFNITNRTDINEEPDDIDAKLENSLFEDVEMQLDDIVPKGDPKFDEEMYDPAQLYIKVKEEDNDIYTDLIDDPDIDKILYNKIEECKYSTEFAKLKAQPKEDNVKTKEDNDPEDSEDETPLSVIKEELELIEEMCRQEDQYERLIKKEHIPEYKYWIRHYDRDFMLRSVDVHTKFDEELKENTPSSFYFVIQECASILNCTNFYLYKSMQNLEEFLVSKSNKLETNNQNMDSTLEEDIDEESID